MVLIFSLPLSMLKPEVSTSIETQTPLRELPTAERFHAWKQGVSRLEGARMELFKDGEEALSESLQELALSAVGTEAKTRIRGRDLVVIRQPLHIPNIHIPDIQHTLPDELKRLIETIENREYSKRTPAEVWLDTPKVDVLDKLDANFLTLGARVGDENFELTMSYHRQGGHWLAPQRKDNEIVNLLGHYTAGFEWRMDDIKDLNRADAFTKLAFALAMVGFVADARS
jgi:hypothetical protein